MEKHMRIGELAKKVGTTVRTLHHYDAEGLLSPSAESDAGYRLYSDKDMVRLIRILMMKQLGMGLAEIKERIQIDTPQDVMEMLSAQISQVRKQVATLTESLEAMEALHEEIAQMETVSFKKYADILLNLKIKSESYRMIKHFDDDALDMFRERIGHKKTALMAETLNGLYKEALELIGQDVLPEDERGQQYAAKFWATVKELSGGDPQMMSKINEQIEKASRLELGIYGERGEEHAVVRAFMQQAIGFHKKPNKLAGLYYDAVKLLKISVSPESEQGQLFAKELWQTIMELSGGDPEKMAALNKQSENVSEEGLEVREFMARALEIYHKEDSK